MITIARDPVDFLTSEVAMSYFYDTSNTTLDKLVNSTLRYLWLNDYSRYFTSTNDMTIVDQFDIIIDYDRLINFPAETIKSVANHMGIEVISQDYEFGLLKDYTEHGHIISSKRVAEYDMVKEYIKDTDLSKLYDIYHAMLDKSKTHL